MTRSTTRVGTLLLNRQITPSVAKKEEIFMDCPSSEPTDPRVRRTRQLLQDALRVLFQEKEYSAISVQDIAARATVNRATFYAHYTDKQDLAASVLKAELHAAVIGQFAEYPAWTRENLVEFAVVIFEFLGNMPNSCPKTTQELQDTVGITLQDEIFTIIQTWLSRSSAYRQQFPGSSKEAVATVLSWSIYGAAYRWSRAERRTPAIKICREIISILLPPVKTSTETKPLPTAARNSLHDANASDNRTSKQR